MLVAVGQTKNGTTNSIEIIDLENPSKICSSIQNFPSKVFATIGGLSFKLPYGIVAAALVTDSRGGVILVGGEAKHAKQLNTLWRLDHSGEGAEWELMPQKLKIGRGFATAFLIPDSIATNCY